MRHGEMQPLGSENFTPQTKGITAEIYRSAPYHDSKLNVVSGQTNNVLVVGEGVTGIYTIENEGGMQSRKVVILRKQWLADRKEFRYVAVPLDAMPFTTGQYAFGGNFIYSSDSRFIAPYAVPLHDRDMRNGG